jgi:hypothetical protein
LSSSLPCKKPRDDAFYEAKFSFNASSFANSQSLVKRRCWKVLRFEDFVKALLGKNSLSP